MRTSVLLFLLCAALLPAVPAHAGPAHNINEILSALSPTTTVPPEWDGIWVTTDSIYTCTGGFQSTSTGKDTLCGGKEIPVPGGINYVCTGTADATTIHMRCTYSYVPIPDCQANYVSVIDGTRTSDTYYYTVRDSTTFSGTGFGCSFLQPTCSIVHIHATRTGPAPSAYCVTAALPTTWGKIKTIYR